MVMLRRTEKAMIKAMYEIKLIEKRRRQERMRLLSLQRDLGRNG